MASTAPLAVPEALVIRPTNCTDALDINRLFERPGPLDVDVGCGKGRFILARATAHPDTNFLGIDRLLRRLRKIDRKATRAGLTNVRLLRLEAAYAVRHLLPPLSVRTFFIFFPDPWPKRRHHRRRLFTPDFLDALDRALLPGGRVEAATDHLEYHDEIREILSGDARFEERMPFVPDDTEKTDFELQFLSENKPIGRCAFEKRDVSGQ